MRLERKPRKDLLGAIGTLGRDHAPEGLGFLLRFEKDLKAPINKQHQLLLKILERNKGTVYGRKYKFKSIKTIEDFQEKLPIITYPDIKDHIEQMKQGKKNVLTTRKVIYYATTSGTTSEPKYIPVTKHRMKMFMQQLFIWGYFVARKNMKYLSGKTLYFAGTDTCGHTKKGVPHGNISGYLLKNLAWYAKKRLAISPEVYDIEDYEARTHMMALIGLQKNVTQIGFAEPIEGILFFNYLLEHRERLITELRVLGKKKIAKQLSKKRFVPVELWPNLSMVSCIKSHMNGLYLETLQRKIGSKDVKLRDPGIYSSEGPITLTITEEGGPGTPLFTMVFFEFLEQEEGAKPVTIDKVEQGKQYLLIITTQEGLYRYNLEDVVEVTGFLKGTPLLRFVHRNKFLDLAAEKCPENEIVKAVHWAGKQARLDTQRFCVIPHVEDLEKMPRYEVLLETDVDDDKTLKQFLKHFDEKLMELVLDYENMRRDYGRLDAPLVSVVRRGGFDAYEKERRATQGQAKLIQVSRDPQFKEQFTIEKTIKG